MTVANKGRFQTLILTSLCLTVHAVPLAGLPLLLPLIRQDLGLTYAQSGSLGSANLLVYALMQIPAGYLADRYSPRKMIVIGVLGLMGLSLLLSTTGQYWQLLGIEFLWGFFSSLIFTPSMSLFTRWFSAEHRGTATTLPVLGMSIGVFAVNLLFPLIANRADSWRPPFLAFGIFGIVMALVLFIFGRDAAASRAPAKFHLDTIRDLFRYKQAWLCYGLQFVRFSIVQGILFWLPSLLVDEKQFALQLTGIVIAIQSILTAAANIFGGYLGDRFKKPTLVIGVSMVMLIISTGLLLPLHSMALVILVVLVNAVFLQAYFGPLFTLAVEILGPEKIGIANGVSNMFAIFGGLFTAYLMGFLRDATGAFEWGFYSICLLGGVGLILTFILQKVRQGKALTALRTRAPSRVGS
jgi:nitrate/nitrite transporter NarK